MIVELKIRRPDGRVVVEPLDARSPAEAVERWADMRPDDTVLASRPRRHGVFLVSGHRPPIIEP